MSRKEKFLKALVGAAAGARGGLVVLRLRCEVAVVELLPRSRRSRRSHTAGCRKTSCVS